jgi:hypothetical protein
MKTKTAVRAILSGKYEEGNRILEQLVTERAVEELEKKKRQLAANYFGE